MTALRISSELAALTAFALGILSIAAALQIG